MSIPLTSLGLTIGVWPLAAAGAAAVSIPIIIHLITRLQRRPVPWAAMQFVMQAYRKQKRRLQLEHLILLFIRCMLPVLLGLALAGVTLTGGWAAITGAATSGGERGRLVVIVLDRSLTTGSTIGGGDTRLSRLKQDATQLINTLDADDRVMVIDALAPAKALLDQPSTDHAAAERAVAALEPGYGHAALQQAVTLAEQTLRNVPRPVPASRGFVVLLSDWSQAAVDRNEQLADAAEALDGLATVVASEPAGMAENIQLTGFTPRRLVQLRRGGLQGVNVSASLRRFARDAGENQTQLVARLIGPDGNELATARRDHAWVAGQTEAQVSLSFPLPADGLADASGVTLLGLDVALEDSPVGDTVPGDNRRFSLVELRGQVTVGVVDQASAAASEVSEGGIPGGTSGGWPAGRWVRAALSPSVAGMSGIVPEAVAPSAMTPESVKPWQVAVVLRPDLLPRPVWESLGAWTRGGGLLWVVAPAADVPAAWGEELRRVTRATWRVGLEPVAWADEEMNAGESETTTTANRGWALATDVAPPAPLALLGSEWARLLAPVRVSQRLPLTLNPATSDAADNGRSAEPWLQLTGGDPLLAGVPVGDGYALVQSVAINTDWTNLPTKPLFVPLLHETIRGLIANSPQARRRLSPRVGEMVTLPAGWAGANRMTPTAPAIDGARPIGLTVEMNENADDAENSEQAASELLIAAEPVQAPGVYRPAEVASGARVVVNVDAAAGDTRAVPKAAVATRLAGAGEVRWLDRSDVAAALFVDARTADLTTLLLWCLLAFLLVEAVLARLFSHATTRGRWGSFFQRTWAWLHGGHHAGRAADGGGR